MIRTKTCPTCLTDFSYEVGPGKDRKHCSITCRVKKQMERRLTRFEHYPLCKGPSCNRIATRISYGLCEACYYRLRRTGTIARPKHSYRYTRSDGYIRLFQPEHPLADNQGQVTEHRVIAYGHYGPGPHPCYWCNTSLQWNEIAIDHLNDQKSDNRPENLLISCTGCNRARGAMIPFIDRLRPEALAMLIQWERDRWEASRAVLEL